MIAHLKNALAIAKNLSAFRGQFHLHRSGRSAIPHAFSTDVREVYGFTKCFVITDSERPRIIRRRQIRAGTDAHIPATPLHKGLHGLPPSGIQCRRLFAATTAREDRHIKLCQHTISNVLRAHTPGHRGGHPTQDAIQFPRTVAAHTAGIINCHPQGLGLGRQHHLRCAVDHLQMGEQRMHHQPMLPCALGERL